MSYYDVLFGVVLRLPSKNGVNIHKNIDDINQKLGEAIKTGSNGFTDFMVVPFGMELVEDDMRIRILNRINYDTEYHEEDNEGDDL